ncbi:MAG: hypothetical protein RSC91_10795 [Clostridia bacterium]
MKTSIRLSLPAVRKVRGYLVERAPLGAFFNALEHLQDFPGELMEALFPGQTLVEVLGTLKQCDGDMLSGLLVRVATVAPRMAVTLVSELTGIDEERLLNDPAIGVAGLAEIIAVWVEVNEIENFTATVSGLFRRARALTETTGAGCKG